jgi:nucleoid DNA-binding protein
MNKSELIDAIASAASLTKAQANLALNGVLEAITNSLKSGDAVTLVGFGTFKVNNRSARTGRNPKTGETIKISAKKSPVFTAGKLLKDVVNGSK